MEKTGTDSTMAKALLTAREAAQYLGVCTSTVYVRAVEWGLSPVRLGRSLRYHRDDLDKLIERNKQAV